MTIDPEVLAGGGLSLYALTEALKHFGYKKAKNGGGFSAEDKTRLAEMKMIVDDMKKDADADRPTKYKQEAMMEQMSENIKIQTGVMQGLPAQLAAAMREAR